MSLHDARRVSPSCRESQILRLYITISNITVYDGPEVHLDNLTLALKI